MALNFPSTPTNGQTYTDDNSVVWSYDGTKWNVVTSNTKKFFSGAKQLRTSSFSLSSTLTAVTYNSQPFDTDDYYDSSNSSRLTVNRNGYYRIHALILTGSNGSGSSYTVNVVKNGSTNLSSDNLGANQGAAYDEIVELQAGDYIELKASESGSVGTLIDGTMLEVARLGLTIGTGITSYEAFSGARATLTSNVSMTSTATAVSWATTAFDSNATVLGGTYWSSGSATRLTAGVTGYFRIKGFIATGTAGSSNSYTVTLKKNGTTNLETINMSANETLELDEIYQLSANDYLELFGSNSGSVGTILSSSYLEIVRLGV